MNYRFHPGAFVDLEEATLFYFQEDPAIELRFADYVDIAIERITQKPFIWPIVVGEIRRYVLNIFPYSILYSIELDHVLIVAVAHQSREPNYWKDRLE